MLLVASRGPVGGLQNALPPLVGFRAKRPPAGSRLRCGSKQEPSIRSLQDCPLRRSHRATKRRFVVFVIGIDPHKGSHSAAVLDAARAAGWRAAGACWASSTRGAGRVRGTVRTAVLGNRGSDRARARCWRSSSSQSVRPCSMCRPHCRRVRGCWTRRGSTRPTQTTPAPQRWSRCATRSCARSCSRTTRPCCGCSRNVTTTWSRIAPEPSLSTAHRVVFAGRRRPAPPALSRPEPRPSCAASARPTKSGSNVDDSRSSSSPRCASRTETSSRSRLASPAAVAA